MENIISNQFETFEDIGKSSLIRPDTGKLEKGADNTIVAGYSCNLCPCPSFVLIDDDQFCGSCFHSRNEHIN